MKTSPQPVAMCVEDYLTNTITLKQTLENMVFNLRDCNQKVKEK